MVRVLAGTCPRCRLRDTRRIYVRDYDPDTKKTKFVAIGWICVNCKFAWIEDEEFDKWFKTVKF